MRAGTLARRRRAPRPGTRRQPRPFALDEASARVIGAYLLVSQGGLAAGSFAWGAVADRLGAPMALALAALGLVAGLALAPFWRLKHAERLDMRPSTHMPQPPAVLGEMEPGRGPVLVIAEYRVHVIAGVGLQWAASLVLATSAHVTRRGRGGPGARVLAERP